MRSSGHLELDPACFADPLGSVENLQRDQVPLLIIVENHTRLVLIALDDACINLEDNAQRAVLTS